MFTIGYTIRKQRLTSGTILFCVQTDAMIQRIPVRPRETGDEVSLVMKLTHISRAGIFAPFRGRHDRIKAPEVPAGHTGRRDSFTDLAGRYKGLDLFGIVLNPFTSSGHWALTWASAPALTHSVTVFWTLTFWSCSISIWHIDHLLPWFLRYYNNPGFKVISTSYRII